jgi:hypothetical protein
MAGLLRLAARSLSRRELPPAPAHRGLAASAAALADDYWSDWEDEEEEARRARASAPLAGTDPAGGAPRGVQWVVMGRPGPQKHAHAARLAEVLAVPYISMGTLVRQELNPASQLYKKVGRIRAPSPPSLENHSPGGVPAVQFGAESGRSASGSRVISRSRGPARGTSLDRVV